VSITERMKKQALFWLILGEKTSLRYHLTREIYHSVKSPWQAAKKLSRRLTGRTACLRIGNSIMEVPEDMFSAFVNGDYYEKNVSYWLLKILLGTKNKIFYDIGANYGYYCLKLADNASQIYAFEPVSRTHDILLKNIQRNNLTNITVYKLGLSDKKNSTEINIYSISGSNSLFLVNLPRDHPAMLLGQEVIDLETLDGLIQEERLSPPDLIKIDIEGGELYALKGARKIIKEHHPVLFIEYSDLTFRSAGYSKDDLLTELNANNYLIYGLLKEASDLNIYPLTEFNNIEVANIMALPKYKEVLLN